MGRPSVFHRPRSPPKTTFNSLREGDRSRTSGSPGVPTPRHLGRPQRAPHPSFRGPHPPAHPARTARQFHVTKKSSQPICPSLDSRFVFPEGQAGCTGKGAAVSSRARDTLTPSIPDAPRTGPLQPSTSGRPGPGLARAAPTGPPVPHPRRGKGSPQHSPLLPLSSTPLHNPLFFFFCFYIYPL